MYTARLCKVGARTYQQVHFHSSSSNSQRNVQRQADYEAALSELPSAQMYEKSFMHRDVVTHVTVGAHDFILTASADGDLRFWKKTPVRAHARVRNCMASPYVL